MIPQPTMETTHRTPSPCRNIPHLTIDFPVRRRLYDSTLMIRLQRGEPIPLAPQLLSSSLLQNKTACLTFGQVFSYERPIGGLCRSFLPTVLEDIS